MKTILSQKPKQIQNKKNKQNQKTQKTKQKKTKNKKYNHVCIIYDY